MATQQMKHRFLLSLTTAASALLTILFRRRYAVDWISASCLKQSRWRQLQLRWSQRNLKIACTQAEGQEWVYTITSNCLFTRQLSLYSTLICNYKKWTCSWHRESIPDGWTRHREKPEADLFKLIQADRCLSPSVAYYAGVGRVGDWRRNSNSCTSIRVFDRLLIALQRKQRYVSATFSASLHRFHNVHVRLQPPDHLPGQQ